MRIRRSVPVKISRRTHQVAKLIQAIDGRDLGEILGEALERYAAEEFPRVIALADQIANEGIGEDQDRHADAS